MSITEQQIEAIKSATAMGTLDELLGSYLNIIRLKQLQSGKNIEIAVMNYKKDKTEIAVARPFLKGNWCYHRSCFGEKGFTITYVKNSGFLVKGKKQSIGKAVVFLENNVSEDLLYKLTLNEEPFRGLTEDELNIFREAQKIGRG